LIVWVGTGPSRSRPDARLLPRVAGSLLTGSCLAFGPTFWSQAVVPEVYSLSALLVLSAVLVFTVWSRNNANRGAGASPASSGLPRCLVGDGPISLLGLLLGLALAHHLTAAFLLPPLALGFLWRRPSGRSVLSSVGLIIIGLSLYAYLPLRAAHDPAILWAPIGTWPEFLEHITGAQYASRLFAAPLAGVAHKMTVFASGVPGEVTWTVLLLVVPGLVVLFRKTRAVAFVLMGWSALVLGHAAVYKIPDIGSYYIPLYAVLAIAGGYGLSALASATWWRRAAPVVGWLAVACAVVVAVPHVRRNWSANDFRLRNDGQLYVERMLSSVAPGGVVVAMNDRVLFPLWYERHVARTRDDFAVISVREHAPHLERWYPGVRFPTKGELCSGLEVSPAGPGGRARDSVPVGNYLPLFVSMNVGERPVYADADLGRRLFLDYAIPRGILVEIGESPVDSLQWDAWLEHRGFWESVLEELAEDPALDRRTAAVYATTLAEHGMLMIECGDIDLAIDALERACALAPDIPLCHNNLGVAYDRSGRFEDGVAEFEAALALAPGLAAPHHNIARSAERGGDTERARRELEVAVELDSYNSSYRIELGALLERVSEFESADAMFRGAASLPEGGWGASLAYGDFLSRRRRYSEAVAAYQHAEELKPGSTGALRGLGRCYWALDDREQALEVMRRLAELQPHNPAAKYDLALMLHRSGRGREAAARLDDVIRILPNMWEARALKASILGELGRHWEARNLFEEAVELGASGDAFWDTWIAMETVLGDAGREAAVQERADRSSPSRGDGESGAVAE
ncbi:MAG: tetratricopeptide repeat protein, partial [Candidatus Eisenbacteria sp.]|nr:tetratricopeptide repeat protein [Candidatus Eisenbacteria bacterium]